MSSRNNDFSDLSDLDDVSRDEDAGIDGDDLDELIEQDYRAIPHLDRYDSDVDNEEYDAMSLNNRRQIEEELDARDGRNQEVDILAPPPSSPHIADSDNLMNEPASNAMSHGYSDRYISDEGPSDDDEEFVNLDDFSGPLREWIALDRPRREIRRRFRAVLTDYEDKNGENYYGPRIASMCADFKQSLLVSYCHISTTAPTLGIWLADCPKEMLELFDDEATAVVFSLFPEYGSVHDRIFVRITDLPVADNIRDLRQVHLNALVRVSGVVTRRTSVYPQLLKIKYDCGKCPLTLGPFVVNSNNTEDDTIHKPSRCPSCESTGPFIVNQSETVYRNYQRITLQESPGSVPAGRVPRTKDVILLNDLRDCARPGEEVDVTGIYMNNFSISLNTQHGFPVFATIVEANYIFKRNDQYANQSLTQEDREMIQLMARQPDIGSRIVASIAPAIYGHDDIRIALALALFGGCSKQSPNAHRIRGDINALMLGDPGTAKSQFLKYIERTSPRAVFTTGKGASAVGLTACVHRDPVSKEWTLEGGALVLADSGHCLIDEFDKMNDKDRTSLHEAMEQQSISISKAGIITTLQARCSIIAAANPLKGRYDSSLTFSENVELTDPILSRFDILCVVRDTVDPIIDEKLAFHVVDSHIKSHPDNHLSNIDEQEAPFDPLLSPIIPQNLLRKYIQYARQYCKPSLVNIDSDKVSKLYIDLRQQSQTAGGIPVAVRHVESILRMAEAHAKMHLRDQVRQDDIDMAIRVMLSSFIGAQKLAVMKHLKGKFQKYMLYKQSHEELLFFLLKQMIQDETYRQDLSRSLEEQEDYAYRSEEEDFDDERESVHKTPTMRVVVPIAELESRARELDIHNVGPFFESILFRSNRFSIEGDTIVRSF